MRGAAWIVALALLTAACTTADTSTEGVAPGRTDGSPETPGAALAGAGDWREMACELPPRYLELIDRGTYPGRSPEIMVVPAKPNFFGSFAVTSHSGPWSYLQRVPLVLYGPGHVAGGGDLTVDREPTSADLAPTLAELLGVEWPSDRSGRALSEALVAEGERTAPPKVMVVVVWDGGGWNVLKQWPKAWPNLMRIMRLGTSVQNAVVGSSPSVTPAIHATVGTGTWPVQHGVVDLQWRAENGRVRGSYDGEKPALMRVPTLADIYDPTTGNEAKVGMLAERNWHMGMIGHGAYLDGGDKDIMVLGSGAGEENYTNENYYTLPDYIRVPGAKKDVRAVDLEDGRLDDTWLGHEILGDPKRWRQTPVQTRYQTRQIKAIFRNEGFGQDEVTDLFYTNYKELDLVGHIYNMLNPESRSVLKQTDAELGDLMGFLDDFVGAGEWVIAVTADHGQGPDPLRFGAWPINNTEMGKDAARRFDVPVAELFDKMRITGFWTNPEGLKRNGITLGALSNWIVNYRLKDNVRPGETVPQQYRDRLRERLFAAAFPSKELPEILECAGRRSG
jgi:Type I phosphodiesterase / nucleotide pyrophosphatase